MMRRDEDCTSLSLNRVFKVTPADREIPSRCGSARGDVGRGPVWHAVGPLGCLGGSKCSFRVGRIRYLAGRGSGRGGVIVNAKFVRLCTLAELNAKGRLLVRGSHRPILVVVDHGHVYAFDNRCPHMGFPLDRGS